MEAPSQSLVTLTARRHNVHRVLARTQLFISVYVSNFDSSLKFEQDIILFTKVSNYYIFSTFFLRNGFRNRYNISFTLCAIEQRLAMHFMRIPAIKCYLHHF